jgi:hypothetical protein
MSGSGLLKTQKQKQNEEIEFQKKLENSELLELICNLLEKILQHLEFITEEKLQ